MAGLIVSGGNAFAESGYPPSVPSQVLTDSRMLLADASLDLDVTMEVVDEDVQSSSAITNVIELPVQIRNQYREMQGNGPGPVDGQGNGTIPAESRPDSGPDVSRPTEAPGPGSPDIRPDSPQEPNRPESPGPDITTPRPDVPAAPRGPETDKAPQMKNDPIMNKGGK